MPMRNSPDSSSLAFAFVHFSMPEPRRLHGPTVRAAIRRAEPLTIWRISVRHMVMNNHLQLVVTNSLLFHEDQGQVAVGPQCLFAIRAKHKQWTIPKGRPGDLHWF